MANVKIKFVPGIVEGAELIMKDLFLNYRDNFNQTMTCLRMDLDVKKDKGEILQKYCGGVMVKHHADVRLGRVGKYPAMQFIMEGRVTEHVFAEMNEEERAEYDVNYGDVSVDFCGKSVSWARQEHWFSVDPLHGIEFRKTLVKAVKHGVWTDYKVGDVVVAINKNLEQVNNMRDLGLQILDSDDYYGSDDLWNQHLVKIEGITECSDIELETYDYFNCKPEGHSGGGWTLDDSEYDDVEFYYSVSQDVRCLESMSSVWMMRGKTKCLFIDCEGHSYSKYLIMPIGYRGMFKDCIEAAEKERDEIRCER